MARIYAASEDTSGSDRRSRHSENRGQNHENDLSFDFSEEKLNQHRGEERAYREWPFEDYVDDPRDSVRRTIEQDQSPGVHHSNLASPRNDTNKTRRHRHRHSTRSRSTRRNSRDTSRMSRNDLVMLLLTRDDETRKLQQSLESALKRLEDEAHRTENAEKLAQEALQRLRVTTESKFGLQQDFARVNEELRLYKLQYDNAQQEILRAQEVLRIVEGQRDEADATAARARNTARELKEELIIDNAREEGRRLGFEAGFRRGQHLGYNSGREKGYEDGAAEMRETIGQSGSQRNDDYESESSHSPEAPQIRAPVVSRQITPPNTAVENFRVPTVPVPTLVTPAHHTPPEPVIPMINSDSRHRTESSRSSRESQPNYGRRYNASQATSDRSSRRPRNSDAPTRERPASGDSWVHVSSPSRVTSVIPPPPIVSHTPSPLTPSIPLPTLAYPTSESSGYVSERGPPQIVRPPVGVVVRDYAYQPPSSKNNGHRRHRSGSESDSTTFSSISLVSRPPSTHGRHEGGPPTVTNSRGPLSAIPEVNSTQGSPAPPGSSGMYTGGSFTRYDLPPQVVEGRSVAGSERDRERRGYGGSDRDRESVRTAERREGKGRAYENPRTMDEPRSRNLYDSQTRRKPSAPGQPQPTDQGYSSGYRQSSIPDDTARNRSLRREGRKSSPSGSSAPDINIQSPSQPSSNESMPEEGAPHLLSPAHASQALPDVSGSRPSYSQPQYQQPSYKQQQPPQNYQLYTSPVIPSGTTSDGGRQVLDMPGQGLPPGFVPMGPPTPVASNEPLPGGSSRQPEDSSSKRRKEKKERARDREPGPPRQIYSPGPPAHKPIPPSASAGDPFSSNRRQSRQSESSSLSPVIPTQSSLPGTSTSATGSLGNSNRVLLRKVSESSLGSEFSHYDPSQHADPAYFPPNRSGTPKVRPRGESSASEGLYARPGGSGSKRR